MPINILGMIGVSAPATQSTVHIVGGGIDPQYITDFSKAHEDAGFDAVLIGHSSSSADGFAIAQHVAYQTERIKILLAHRPALLLPPSRSTCRNPGQFDQRTTVVAHHYWRC